MGQLVHTQPARSLKVEVRVDLLAAGLYFIAIHSGSERLVKKVVMMR
jgi:hypothetical protein